MNCLTEEQIDFIVQEVQQRGLQYAPLVDELIDHLCCATENKIAKGSSFETAYQIAFDSFGADGLAQVEHTTLHLLNRHQRLMKQLMLTAMGMAAGLLLVLTFSLQAQEIPTLLPIKKAHLIRVSAGYGRTILKGTRHEKMHRGVDFVVPIGTPVLATANGVVRQAKTDKGWGKFIELSHDETYASRYGHLSKILVQQGQVVKKGDLIGYSGNTGQSTGPHLHYEVYKEGERVDPAQYFKL